MWEESMLASILQTRSVLSTINTVCIYYFKLLFNSETCCRVAIYHNNYNLLKCAIQVELYYRGFENYFNISRYRILIVSNY